jgi:hypothetical protein
MDYSKIESVGPLLVESLDSLGSYTANDEGRLIYGNTDQLLYYGRSGGFKSLIDIPRDSRIIIESNTAVVGYTLLTDQDDDVIYVTRGSAAGGEIGGSPKLAGTWTQSTHSHGMSHYHTGATHYHNQDHNHIISQHTHKFVAYSSPGYTYSWNSLNNLARVQDYGTQHTTGLVVNVADGSDPASTSGDMYVEALAAQWLGGATVGTSSWASSYNHSTYSSSTTPSGTASGWKPLGTNFTRQQRV